VRLWNAVATIVTTSLDVLAKAITAWGGEIVKIWTGDFSTLQNIVESWADTVQSIWTAIGQAFTDYLVSPIRDAWTGLSGWLNESIGAIRNMALGAWTAMAEGLRNAFRGVLQFIANAINSVASRVNAVIRAFNALPNVANIPLIPILSVPAFAQGGIVDRPTLALVGDGGEREYIIGESKMQEASSRFLSGARGADVIPSRASSRSESGSASPQINITTGPVMQQQDGSQWVSMDDYERGLQQVTEQIVGALRTPQARVALGW
jgi:phage-related protein